MTDARASGPETWPVSWAPEWPEDWPAPDLAVDARGLECPEPVLHARRALRARLPGTRLCVAATDEHAVLDIEAFCARGGHQLEAWREAEGVYWFLLKRGAGAPPTG